jgi:hypothetical protein
MLRPGTYKPNRLLRELGGLDRGLGIVGVHLFTFNQVVPTWRWYEKAHGETKRSRR